jgi:hypothetical protein
MAEALPLVDRDVGHGAKAVGRDCQTGLYRGGEGCLTLLPGGMRYPSDMTQGTV